VTGERCPKCGSEISASLDRCTSCNTDIGPPNVRACRAAPEKKVLKRRLEDAKLRARGSDCEREFAEFLRALRQRSGVVVSMPAGYARNLATDKRQIYAGYEALVGAGMRAPAQSEADRKRFSVSGMLFGSYAAQIRYGVLSLNSFGLSTYGLVAARLRDVTIKERVSFTEWNSFTFCERVVGSSMMVPPGHRAVWGNRADLAAAKLQTRVNKGQGESDWQGILVQSDGANRADDDFVEAHIFGGFDICAVEDMRLCNPESFSRRDRLDGELAVKAFRKMTAERAESR
jgi:hypothetical protein